MLVHTVLTVDEHAPLIRIEPELAPLDEAHAGGPESPCGPAGRGPAVVVAIGVLVLVFVGLIALRPEDGQSADGAQRQAPTTTTIDPSAPTPTTTTTTPPDPLVATRIDVDGSIGEIVRTNSGYLAVLDQAAPRESPPLATSIDGQRWTVLQTPLVVREEDDPRRSPVAEFLGLRATDDQLSVLRVRRLRGNTDTFVVDQLRSAEGTVWSVDEQFGELFVIQAAPMLTSGDDLLLSVSGPLPNTRVASLAELAASTGTGVAFNPRTDVCTAGEREAADTASQISEFRSIGEAGASEPMSGVGMVTAPHILETSRFIVALGRPIPVLSNSCDDGEVPLPEPRGMTLLVWGGPGSAQEVPLNIEEAGVTEQELIGAVSLGTIGEGLFVATERGLVLIERNGDVERIGSLSVDPTEGAPSAVPGEAGLEILDVRDGLLRRWMISNEAITTSQDLVRGQTGFGNVLYADSDVAVTSSATGDRAIQLSER